MSTSTNPKILELATAFRLDLDALFDRAMADAYSQGYQDGEKRSNPVSTWTDELPLIVALRGAAIGSRLPDVTANLLAAMPEEGNAHA